MLSAKNAAATIPVRDIQAAKRFYEGTVGLNLENSEEPEALVFKSGHSKVLVYQSQFAGTNQATAATWGVGNDLEKIVQELKAKGVSFERYDMPDLTRQGDIYVSDGMKVAWFKDPDGNILALVSD